MQSKRSVKLEQRAAQDRLDSRLENIESALKSIQRNQRDFLGELGMEFVKVLAIASALLLLLYFGVDDFTRKMFQK